MNIHTKSKLFWIGVFLLCNFGLLGLGAYLQGPEGVQGDWYVGLDQAPWTPPGWVFGAAWSTIMICYAVYMGILVHKNSIASSVLYSVQFALNLLWNPLFLLWQNPEIALIDISLLLILIVTTFFYFRRLIPKTSYLLLPYIIWLIIATSLNAYIVFYN